MEKAFVNNFIVKTRRERLFFELRSDKKRKNAIGRFCHISSQYLDDSKILIKSKTITRQEIKDIINKYIDREWYLISWDENFDGKVYKAEEALNIIMNMGMAAIMFCGDYAIVIEEQEKGAPDKYVLYNCCK